MSVLQKRAIIYAGQSEKLPALMARRGPSYLQAVNTNEAAQLYENYLLAPEQQSLAVDKGLRPPNPAVPLHRPIALDDGTDLRVTPAIVPSLESPSILAAEAIQDVFDLTRRKDIPTEP